MYRLEREEFLEPKRISLWALLGFQAGFLNAFGFLSCGWFVSHVTGIGTQIGMSVGQNNIWYEFELVGFPLAFIFGAFVSGYFTSARLERGLAPLYDRILLVIPTGIALLMIAGGRGLFGLFGEGLIQWHDFVLLYSLTFICGLQNGCIAVLTKGQIRTTHMTGISTDIGTDLSRYWFGGLKKAEKELTRKANLTRIWTFAAFLFGSVLSVIETKRFHYLALWIPLVSSAIICIAMFVIRKKLDREKSN